MADERVSLVLHLASSSTPLTFTLEPEQTETLAQRLPEMLERGGVESVATRDHSTVLVNFGHVAVAYVDDNHTAGAGFGLRQRP
ncbi:hypothetical protein H0B56_01525 [Haloechinothrix sp. YIM 98757]|uniref:Uncharacterized protein n=1 Tax=Haloechinothrix aidingensis TaxID=2752311 RepID=A0A838A7G5_9PSEU|nr:hypothetical protein [Haloechinothrix aidingensis]MBA0124219.1 hypothetical protein [Haloechinothrix aidingensis]